MTVFHCCANKLKNEPLFSDNDDDDSDSDGNNFDEGSKYNEYDKADDNLFNIHEISGFNFSQESFQCEIASTTEEVSFSVIPDEMLDTSFLLHDESHPELWQRDNKHLIYDGDTNSRDYHEAVLLLAAGRYQRADYCENNLRRFQIKGRKHWSGVDSLYDAWFILEGKTRKEFNYELFLLRFPGWEDHIQLYYRPPTSQQVEKDESDNDQPRFKKARKRKCNVHSSDEVTLKKAAAERLEKQNKERTTSLAEDIINQPQEMSKQVTMEPEATELQKESRGHTTPYAEDEIYQSRQMYHEDTIEPKTNKDESVAFKLMWSMKLNDHTDNVNKLLATHA